MIQEVSAPYSSVNFTSHTVLVAAPTFEKSPNKGQGFSVPLGLLSETVLAGHVQAGAINASAEASGGSGSSSPTAATSTGAGGLKASTSSSFSAANNGVLELPMISADPLRYVLNYLENYHSNGCKVSTIPQPVNPAKQPLQNILTGWEFNFIYGPGGILKGPNKEGPSEVERMMLSEVMIAADFIGVPSLIDLCGAVWATMLQGHTPAQIRDLWGMENDLLPEESKKFREENAWADEAM